MTDRPRILALAAEYDKADKRNTRGQVPEREALLEALYVATGRDGVTLWWMTPSGVRDSVAARVVRAWVAASRRAAKPPRPTTGKRGPIRSDRIHRLDVPATEATMRAVKAHAARTGRTRATVAGDFLEAGAKIKAGKGGEHD